MPEVERETGDPTRPKRRRSIEAGTGECVVEEGNAEEVGMGLGHVVHLEPQVTCKEEPIVTGAERIAVGEGGDAAVEAVAEKDNVVGVGEGVGQVLGLAPEYGETLVVGVLDGNVVGVV